MSCLMEKKRLGDVLLGIEGIYLFDFIFFFYILKL